jgi:excisionase family DNA binding protein
MGLSESKQWINHANHGKKEDTGTMPRFLTLADVAEQLQISAAACYQLVHSGELPAFQIGGRGQWRVDEAKFEQFIEDRHSAARAMLASENAAQPAAKLPR